MSLPSAAPDALREQRLAEPLDLMTGREQRGEPSGVEQVAREHPDLALVLGLIIGVALALVREALDTRIRTADEIGAETGLTLLGRLPAPPRGLRAKNRLVMLADPFGPRGEVEAMRLSPVIRYHWAGDGDHDLGPRGGSGFTRKSNLAAAADAVAAFTKGLA